MTRTWGGSAIGGDIVLELTPSFFFLIYFNYYKITANFLVFKKLSEEVDYGSCGSSANPPTDSDHKWSTSENDSQD